MAASSDDRRNETRPGTQAVERAIAILECFRGDVELLGISEIARAVGLNVSTAHRLMRALVAAGFMEQDPMSERYRLGSEVAVLGQRALSQRGYDLAKPVLAELASSTGESVSMALRRGQEAVVIEAAASAQRLRFDHPVGAELPLHASGMGKVLLAFSGLSADETVAGLRGLPMYTAKTITQRAALIDELRRIRKQGYALNEEEREAGVSGVAVPVLGPNSVARAAVGVQGPSMRMSHDRLLEILPTLHRASQQLAGS